MPAGSAGPGGNVTGNALCHCGSAVVPICTIFAVDSARYTYESKFSGLQYKNIGATTLLSLEMYNMHLVLCVMQSVC